MTTTEQCDTHAVASAPLMPTRPRQLESKPIPTIVTLMVPVAGTLLGAAASKVSSEYDNPSPKDATKAVAVAAMYNVRLDAAIIFTLIALSDNQEVLVDAVGPSLVAKVPPP